MPEKRTDNKGRILRRGESQRTNGTYCYRWSDGRGTQQAVYAKTLKELRVQEERIQRDIADGINYRAGEQTVAGLVDRYLSLKRNLRTNTLRAYSTANKRLHADAFGQRRIRDVKKSDAKAWFIQLHDEGLKRNTIGVYLNLLKPAFEMAVEDEIIRKNPYSFNLSELLPDDANKRVSLTAEQQRRLLNFAAGYNDGQYYNDIVVLLETGLRVSELYGITFSDIDFEKRLLYVRRQLCRTAEKPYFVSPPKTSHGTRTIPLSNRAIAALENELSNRNSHKVEMIIDGVSGFVFLDSYGKPKVAMHLENYMRIMMQEYRIQSNDFMPTVTPHVLRHTFCTNIQESGMDFRCVQAVMGHSEPDITMLYTHLDEDFIVRSFRAAVS